MVKFLILYLRDIILYVKKKETNDLEGLAHTPSLWPVFNGQIFYHADRSKLFKLPQKNIMSNIGMQSKYSLIIVILTLCSAVHLQAQPTQKMVSHKHYLGVVQGDNVVFFQPRKNLAPPDNTTLKGSWVNSMEWEDTTSDAHPLLPVIKITAGTKQIITSENMYALISDSVIRVQGYDMRVKDPAIVYSIPKDKKYQFIYLLSTSTFALVAICNNQLVITDFDHPFKPFDISENNTFRIPGPFTHVFIYDGNGDHSFGLLVQTKNTLQFYGKERGIREGRYYKHLFEYDFPLPVKVDEVFTYDKKYIGLRTGRLVKFYSLNEEKKKWEYDKDLDFLIPLVR